MIKKDKNEKYLKISKIATYLLSSILGFTLYYYFGSSFYIFAFALLLGLTLPKLILNKWKYEEDKFNKIVWLNLIFGLFYTPLGVFFGVFTIKYNSTLLKSEKQNKYEVLGKIGICLSLLNFLLALILPFALSR